MKVVVAGLGDSGSYIVKYLLEENFDITIIDKDSQKIKTMSDNEEVAGIIGDITDIDTFYLANIKEADIFIAATDNDEINILATQLAKHFGAKYNLCVLKDSKYQSEDYKDLFRDGIIPIDEIISIDNSMIKSIVEQIKYNYLNISNVLTFFNEGIKMFSIVCNEDSMAVNKTVSSIYESLREKIHFRIVGLQRNSNFNIAVDSDIIKEGDIVFLIVEEKYIKNIYALFFDIEQLSNKFLASQSPNIIISGDHPFIKILAINLAKFYYRIKVITNSKNESENVLLAMDLEKYGIQLIEDSITKDDYRNNYIKSNNDIIIIINKDDNETILQALTLKYQDFTNLFCYLNTNFFENFLLSHQVHHTITPSYFMMSSILSYVRRGVIMNTYSLNKKVEAIEIMVSENSKIIGKKVSEVEIAGKLMISMVIDEQGNVIYIEDSTIIKAHYQLIIVVSRKYITTMEEDFLQNIDHS
ncbi:MAG: NAD-binding protein [Alphaproteobacteria bacterium]|jgi:trk system potassium uptake protein TrkA|nr:NAD-binding protein [Alphaproteobacteria bacterium]